MTRAEAIQIVGSSPLHVNGEALGKGEVAPQGSYVQFRQRLPKGTRESVHYEVHANTDENLYVRLDVEDKAHCRDAVKRRLGVGKQTVLGMIPLKDATPEQVLAFVQEKLSEAVDTYEEKLKELEDEYSRTGTIGESPSGHGALASMSSATPELKQLEPPEELVDNVISNGDNPFGNDQRAVVITTEQLLRMNLRIPSYQRQYKWTRRNVEELIGDIKAASGKKYRLGTVILDASRQDGKLDVVDGQQRILTLLLINRAIDSIRMNKVECPIQKDDETLKLLASSPISRQNLHENYTVVRSLLAKDYGLRKAIVLAFNTTLEMVVVKVDRLAEAFQLFDSQNTRGRPLDPHDLLKAHHLRAMSEEARDSGRDAQKVEREMESVVQEWESHSPDTLRELFDGWLFRIGNWIQKRKTHPFSVQDLYVFKGVPFKLAPEYSYALRARAAMPGSDDPDRCRQFQIGSDFVEGREFFRMTTYYLGLVNKISGNECFSDQTDVMRVIKAADGSQGSKKIETLFRCALLCYVDRFGLESLKDSRVVRKLCQWAFMLRLNMAHVTEDTINRYAVIEGGADYTNAIPLFAKIKAARSPSELAIAEVYGIGCNRHKRKAGEKKRGSLVEALKGLEA